MLRFVAIAVLVLSASGCATGRLADLGDSGSLSVGLSFGLTAHASLGDLLQPCIGTHQVSVKMGYEGGTAPAGKRGHTWFAWVEEEWCDPFYGWVSDTHEAHPNAARHILGMFGGHGHDDRSLIEEVKASHNLLRERSSDLESKAWCGDFLKYCFSDVERWLPLPDPELDNVHSLGSFHTVGKLEAGATLGIVSARVALNPPELLDFLLGFVGLDIGRDDHKLLAIEPAPEAE